MSLDNNNNNNNNNNDNYKAIIAAPSKSLRSRLHEGILDFCERMADIEAGRHNQYAGIPQQLHDAEDERRRLRKKAQKAKEQGYQKNSNDDAAGGEHDDDTDADKVDDRRKKDKATNIYWVDNDKTTTHTHKLRKDKTADKGVVHDIQKLQKRPPGHGKQALTGGKTPTEPKEGFQQMNESSSDEELQWITDRMMLGDLDEVPVVLGHPKTETPKSLNATGEPVLRLRGGSGGAGGKHRQRAYNDDNDDDNDNEDDEDLTKAIVESVKGIPRDIPRGIPRGILRYQPLDREKRVHFADEPNRYAPFCYNPHAGSSPKYGFGGGARNPTSADRSSRGESSKYGGSKGSLHFGQSSGYKSKGNDGAGVGFSRGVRGVDFGESSSSQDNSGKRGAGVKYLIVDSSDEGGVESGRSSREKNKGKDHRRRRHRSPSSSPRPTRTRNHGSPHGKSRKRSSKVAQETDSSSNSEEDRSNSSDEEESDSSSKSAKVIKTPPPDHYAVLGLTHDCSAQQYVDRSSCCKSC